MSSELVILGFPSKSGAKRFLSELLPLQEHHLIRVEDAALAMKDERGRIFGSSKVDLAAHGFLGGSIWGALTGALFLEPFLGLLLGGGIGLLTGSLFNQAERGISSELVKKTSHKALEPGHSALFLLISKATPDKVLQKMCHHDATIISTSLSLDSEKKLRDAWAKVKANGPLSLHNGPSEMERSEPFPISTKKSHRTVPLGH